MVNRGHPVATSGPRMVDLSERSGGSPAWLLQARHDRPVREVGFQDLLRRLPCSQGGAERAVDQALGQGIFVQARDRGRPEGAGVKVAVATAALDLLSR